MSNRFSRSKRDPATEPPAARRPSRLRGWGRWAVGLLLLLVLLAAAFIGAVELGWQRQRILSVVLALAEEQLGLEISATATAGRLSRGMTLRNVRIGDPQHPVVEIDTVRIRWNAFSLLSRDRWVAESLAIEGWSLRLHRSAEGEWIVVDDLLARFSPLDSPPTTTPVEGDPALGFLIRRIDLGPGSLFVTLDRKTEGLRLVTDPAAGPLRAQLQVEGTIQGLDIHPDEPLEAETTNLRARLVESDSGIPELDRDLRLEAELRLVARHIDTLEADLRAPGLVASAHLTGEIERFDRAVFELDAEDLRPLSGWFQVEPSPLGRVKVSADLSGPPDALTGSLTAEARGLVFEDLHARELDLELEFADPISVALEDPTALNSSVRLRARGFDLVERDREWLPPGEADIDLVGEIAAGSLDVERAQVRMAGLTLDAKGRTTRDTIGGLDLDVDVQDVGPWLRVQSSPLPIRGGLHARARLEGPVAKPIGEIVLESGELYFADRSVGALNATLKRGRVGPAILDFALGATADSPLRARAEIDLDRQRVDFTAAGDAAPWMRIFETAPSIRGRVSARGHLERTPTGPRFALALQASDTGYESHALGAVELEAHSESGDSIELSRLEIDGATGFLTLARPAAIQLGPDGDWAVADLPLRVARTREATAVGAIDVRAAGSRAEIESFESSFEALPVSLANQFLPDRPALDGRLAGRASWQRTRAPEWTTGDLEWTDPMVGAFRLDHVLVHWKGEARAIGFDVETRIANRSPLTASGRVLLPDRELGLMEILRRDQFSVQLDLDEWELATLDALSPTWVRRIAGRVSGSIRIEHDATGMHLNGGARVAGGSFTIPLLRQRFSPVIAEIRLADDRIMIETLRVGATDAMAEFTGSFDYSKDESPILDARLRLDHFPIARSSAAWMNLLGEIELSGSVAMPVARGALSVEDAKIGVAASDDPILKEIRIATRTSGGSLQEPQEADTPPLHSAEVDISIEVPGSTRVRGQGANLFVEGQARLSKRPFEPLRVYGEARVVNGAYTFQGRRFDVRRGRLLLTGDEKFDPVVDVEARLPVAQIVAIVQISGRLSSPIIRLSSEPSLSDQDILAYMLFGRPADQVSGASGAKFDAAAARLVAGVAEQEMREILGDAMPIDSIEIGADEEGGTSEIGFGKYVGRNLYFRYVHILGDEPADRVGIEYRLNDQFSIGSSVTTTGDAGLDLILRHDF